MDAVTAPIQFDFDAETNSFVAFDNGSIERKLMVGYGFAGRDFVIGDEGRHAWEKAQGRGFAGGNDGTYAVVSQSGRHIRIETDHAGHLPIFYYQDGRVAAASNSIIRLVEHFRRVGVDMRPNSAEVVARGTDFFPLHQLATYETAVAGVSLLPKGCSLRIEGGHCIVERLPRRTPTDYHDDLKTCITTWTDRIATLLESDTLQLSVDLSGGLDSRTVFSLFHNVMRDAPPGWMERISVYSHGFLSPSDPQIAEEVLRVSEAELRNGHRWRRFFSSVPNTGTSTDPIRDPLRKWWASCGGIYSPNYMVSMPPDPGMVFFGGGGGEGYRNFYSNYFTSPDHLAAMCQRRAALPDQTEWLREGIMSAFRALESTDDGKIHPMNLYYREFRGRLHGGLRSRSRCSFMPIASDLLAVAAESLAPETMNEGQIFHDIIHNCAAPLIDVRFDQDKKAPTPSIRDRLASCGTQSIKPVAGTVFGTPVRGTPGESKINGFRQLAEAVEAAAQRPYVREIWDQSAIQQAIDMTRDAAKAGRFSHPNPPSLISGILMAAMFD
jgi:hypothetical protein